ncbi:MAG: MFS transporter [Nanoarchaeota archaeon]
MQTNKNIFLWVLYDFANSLVSIVFFLYFAQWIVVDKGVSDFYFNLTFTISALLLLITVPISGTLLDKYLRRITGLRYATAFTVFFYGVCALAALYDKQIPALIFFTLGLYFYLLSFTFYTPLLHDIAPIEKRGKVSGFGITANYLGQFVGLLITLPFSTGAINIFSASPRAETLVPSVLAFGVLSLPMLLFFKEPHKKSEKISIKNAWRQTLIETKLLFSVRNIFFFLLAYFLFNDAILTASTNFPIVMEQVWGVSDTVKTYLLIGILITSAIGGSLAGFISDKQGHKRVLTIILAGWIIILPVLGFIANFTLFIVATIMMGLWFGATWTVSRSLMADIAPLGKHNIAFAYFGLAERASSFIGPLVWGATVSSLVSLGSMRYRIAILVITGFIVLGLIALTKVKTENNLLKIQNNP